MKGPCAKQRVVATLISVSGRRYVGTNDVENAQAVCPRELAGMKTGEGYALCKSVCAQGDHAEVAAIKLAKAARHGDAIGSRIYLEGHTYACKPCQQFARDYGVAMIIIGSPPPLRSALDD